MERALKRSPGAVLITGSSTGFGASMALVFARAGYDVILHGRNGKRLRLIQRNIAKETKAKCFTVIGDIQAPSGIRGIKKALHARRVNIFVNNAAVNPELGRKVAMGDIKSIADTIATNTTSAIALCYAAFEHFVAQGGGTIININSVAGLRGSSREASYAASKFGLRGFSESVKESWLKQGVRMMDVYPGAIAIGMSAARSDVGDLIDPAELAELLVRLCATKSFFLNELSVRRTAVSK